MKCTLKTNKNEKSFLKEYIGREIEVLFEQKEGEYFKGHTSNYIVVRTKNESLANRLIKIKITKEDGLELKGDILK